MSAPILAPEPFYDRNHELATLLRAWQRPAAGLALVYGRRRLGKTYLLQRFLSGLGTDNSGVSARCSYIADQSTAEVQRLALAERLISAFPPTGLQPSEIASSWNALLRFFAAQARRCAEAGKSVLVLDEFPYLVTQSPELPSTIQAWWDEEGSMAPVFVVLCGSQLSVMASLANETAPLHGRFNAGRLRVEPMDYMHIAEFYSQTPGYGPRELLLMYGALGGTPRYHSLVDPTLAWDEQIVDLLLRPDAPFSGEARLLLLSEQVRDPTPYNAVLGAISRGCSKHAEIQNATGINAAGLTHPLAVLQDLGWITRERSYGETTDRRSLYRLADPFLTFWHRYGAPLASALTFSSPMDVFHQRIEPTLDDYMGRFVFEGVCAQWLRARASTALGLSVDSLSRYRSRDSQTEIDIVADLSDGGKLFCECKWSPNSACDTRILARLRAKVASLPDPDWHANAEYAIFCLGGFDHELLAISRADRHLHLIDASMMY